MALIIIGGTVLIPLFIKPDFVSPINHYVKATFINGTISYFSVSVLLFCSSLINQRSLNTAEKEIAANKALSADLDQKVKDRTKEIKEKNIKLLNIENNLKKENNAFIYVETIAYPVISLFANSVFTVIPSQNEDG